jgi:DNA (cytosine-5)-methyltransferase 1
MRLLDLFCGAGGAATGYHRAGFTEIVGVDIKPQPRYPFEILEGNALWMLESLVGKGSICPTDSTRYWLEDFDAIHASPPCQAYSRLKAIHRFGTSDHKTLIDPTRKLLVSSGLPWVIENVPGSNLENAIVLCGSMFGLGAVCDGIFHQLRRHREFETSFFFLMSLRCRHMGRPVGVYGNGGPHRRIKDRPGINGFTGNAGERRAAMGIDWMDRYECSQAVPPAYTEFIGRQLIAHIRHKATESRT